MPVVSIVFWLAALVAVAGGFGVIFFREPIRSVLSLVLVMLALAVEFLLLSAQFIFAVQIIVYAGAVMVLFLFVIALLGPIKEQAAHHLRFQWWLAIPVSGAFFGLLWAELQGVRYHDSAKGVDLSTFGSVEGIAYSLFTTYLYPFELTSIMLLVAAVGAIYLSKRHGRGEGEDPELRLEGETLPSPEEDR